MAGGLCCLWSFCCTGGASATAVRLQQAQAVDIQLEGQLQEFRRPAAEEHPLQKDLEVVHHGAEFGVDAQGEGEGAPLRVQCQLGALGGIVDPVMDVKL